MCCFLGIRCSVLLLSGTLGVVEPSYVQPPVAEGSSVRIDHKGHSILMRHHRQKHQAEEVQKEKDGQREVQKEKDGLRGHQNIDSPIEHHASVARRHQQPASSVVPDWKANMDRKVHSISKDHHARRQHQALRAHQHEAADFEMESARSSPQRPRAKPEEYARNQRSHKRLLPSSHATDTDGNSYSIANSNQMCDPQYEPVDDLLDCQDAMIAFGASWKQGEPCSGGPKGCSIRRDILPVVSWVDNASDPEETVFPRCNILCKKNTNSMLEINSRPEGPPVSATCPEGYERELGDTEPEWGDTVLGSYWGARHANDIDECAGQCSNVTDCMSFKWSPNYLQGAIPEHPCILTVNKHITTNSTFHDFIFCAKMSAGNEEADEESAELLYAGSGADGIKKTLLKKDSRQDVASSMHEEIQRLSVMP